MRYKALSVKQPWANLITQGRKTIETRKWATNYRGPLLICASKSIDAKATDHACKLLNESRGRINYPRGVALCLVDLVGCEKVRYWYDKQKLANLEAAACCPVSEGLCCWHLGNVRRLKSPLPEVNGSLRLFNVELERVVLL